MWTGAKNINNVHRSTILYVILVHVARAVIIISGPPCMSTTDLDTSGDSPTSAAASVYSKGSAVCGVLGMAVAVMLLAPYNVAY